MGNQDSHKQTEIERVISEFLATLKARNLSEKSLESWEQILKQWRRFVEGMGLERPQDVELGHLEQYRLSLTERQLAGATVYMHLVTVRRLFAYLEEKQEIFANPARDMVVPCERYKLVPVPNEEDIRKLMEQPDLGTPAGVRDRALLEVGYSTALRLSELAGLNMADPNLKDATVRVLGKGSKERVVPLGRQAIAWLEEYVGKARSELLTASPDEPALWLGRMGCRFHVLLIGRMVRDYGKRAGIGCGITTHSLRRACATHMLRGGAHPAAIQMLLGHASLNTLSSYLRVSIADLQAMHAKARVGE